MSRRRKPAADKGEFDLLGSAPDFMQTKVATDHNDAKNAQAVNLLVSRASYIKAYGTGRHSNRLGQLIAVDQISFCSSYAECLELFNAWYPSDPLHEDEDRSNLSEDAEVRARLLSSYLKTCFKLWGSIPAADRHSLDLIPPAARRDLVLLLSLLAPPRDRKLEAAQLAVLNDASSSLTALAEQSKAPDTDRSFDQSDATQWRKAGELYDPHEGTRKPKGRR